jgi:hypothetical protein
MYTGRYEKTSARCAVELRRFQYLESVRSFDVYIGKLFASDVFAESISHYFIFRARKNETKKRRPGIA